MTESDGARTVGEERKDGEGRMVEHRQWLINAEWGLIKGREVRELLNMIFYNSMLALDRNMIQSGMVVVFRGTVKLYRVVQLSVFREWVARVARFCRRFSNIGRAWSVGMECGVLIWRHGKRGHWALRRDGFSVSNKFCRKLLVLCICDLYNSLCLHSSI